MRGELSSPTHPTSPTGFPKFNFFSIKLSKHEVQTVRCHEQVTTRSLESLGFQCWQWPWPWLEAWEWGLERSALLSGTWSPRGKRRRCQHRRMEPPGFRDPLNHCTCPVVLGGRLPSPERTESICKETLEVPESRRECGGGGLPHHLGW